METMVPEVGRQLLQGAVIRRATAHIEFFPTFMFVPTKRRSKNYLSREFRILYMKRWTWNFFG